MASEAELMARAWRLAAVLTGRRERAERVLTTVVRPHPSLARDGESRLDRAVVLAAAANGNADERDVLLSADADPGAQQLWKAAHTLDRGPREAWLLLELLEKDDVVASRALGVARTPLLDYAEQARARLRALMGGDYDGALTTLRSWAAGLTPGEAGDRAVAARRGVQRRRRIITVVQVLAFVGAAATIAYVMKDLMSWDEARDAEREIVEQNSVLLPDAAEGIER